MRAFAVPALLTVLLLAAACGEGERQGAGTGTRTVTVTEAEAEPAPATAEPPADSTSRPIAAAAGSSAAMPPRKPRTKPGEPAWTLVPITERAVSQPASARPASSSAARRGGRIIMRASRFPR